MVPYRVMCAIPPTLHLPFTPPSPALYLPFNPPRPRPGPIVLLAPSGPAGPCPASLQRRPARPGPAPAPLAPARRAPPPGMKVLQHKVELLTGNGPAWACCGNAAFWGPGGAGAAAGEAQPGGAGGEDPAGSLLARKWPGGGLWGACGAAGASLQRLGPPGMGLGLGFPLVPASRRALTAAPQVHGAQPLTGGTGSPQLGPAHSHAPRIGLVLGVCAGVQTCAPRHRGRASWGCSSCTPAPTRRDARC